MFVVILFVRDLVIIDNNVQMRRYLKANIFFFKWLILDHIYALGLV